MLYFNSTKGDIMSKKDLTKPEPIRIFRIGEETYRIKKRKKDQDKFKAEYAYITDYGKYVYIYRKEVECLDECIEPGIYIYDNVAYMAPPITLEDEYKYSVDRVKTITPDSIFKSIEDDLIDYPTDIGNVSDVFKPTIQEGDDISLAGMKYVLGKKNISFNSYAHRFTDMSTKNNGRKALLNGNTLKMSMLSRFAEVFDINAAMLLWDKPGCINPISPNRDTVYMICDSDDIDLKSNKVKISHIEKEI